MLSNLNKSNKAQSSKTMKLSDTKSTLSKKLSTALVSMLGLAFSSTAMAETYQVVYHVVEEGDTLTGLTKKFNVSIKDMKKVNKLKTDTIKTGDRLLVPINKIKISTGKSSTSKKAGKAGNKTKTKTKAKTKAKNTSKTKVQGKKKATSKNIKTSDKNAKKYQVKYGDTLLGIANKQGVKVATLLDINNIDINYSLKAGDLLLIPNGSSKTAKQTTSKMTGAKKTTKKTKSKTKQEPSKKVTKNKPVTQGKKPKATRKKLTAKQQLYEVQSGDNLAIIAKKFSMSRTELAEINDIKNVDLLQAGQKLIVNKTKTAKSAKKAVIGKKTVKKQAGKGSDKKVNAKKVDDELPKLGKNQTSYVVQSGDNLIAIANLFAVTEQALIKANKLENSDYLVVGQVLIIPKKIKAKPVSIPRTKPIVQRAISTATY